jgi:hypothetical protein
MEPEGSLTFLQELASSSYSEPDEHNPHPSVMFLRYTFNVVLPFARGSFK